MSHHNESHSVHENHLHNVPSSNQFDCAGSGESARELGCTRGHFCGSRRGLSGFGPRGPSPKLADQRAQHEALNQKENKF